MAQAPLETVRELIQDSSVTVYTANEVGIIEFMIVDLSIARNTANNVAVDVYIDDGSEQYFIVKNREITDEGYRLDAKGIILNTNDTLVARPTTGVGEFVVTATIAKYDVN